MAGQGYINWNELPDQGSPDDYGIDWNQLPDQGGGEPPPKKPQGWVDWGIEQALRTAPGVLGSLGGGFLGAGAGGIGAIPGAMAGGAGGAALGDILGDWWTGEKFDPYQLGVTTAFGAAPPIFGGAGKVAGKGAWELAKYAGKRGLEEGLESAVQGAAQAPFDEWVETGNWTPSSQRLIGNTLGGFGAGTVLGSTLGGAIGRHYQGRSAPPVDVPPTPIEATPPPPTAANVWDAGMGSKKYYEVTPEPVYGPISGPYGTGEGQMNLGLDDPTQGQLGLGPYRAPSGRMTNTGPGMPPRMGPEVGELPIQQGAGVEDPWLDFYPEQGNMFGQPPPTPAPVPRETPASQGWYESPSGGMVQGTPPVQAPPPSRSLQAPPPPPIEPPAGGPIAPPVAPPVTQAVAQAPNEIPGVQFTSGGEVAVLVTPNAANVGMLRGQGFVPIPIRGPNNEVLMVKGSEAPLYVTGEKKIPAAPVARPLNAFEKAMRAKSAAQARPDVPGAITAGMQAAEGVHAVPNEKATLKYVNNMLQGGYRVSHRDATTTYFTTEPEGPAFQRVFGDDESRMRPGEQPQGVAPFDPTIREPQPGSPEWDAMAESYDNPPISPEDRALMESIDREIALERREQGLDVPREGAMTIPSRGRVDAPNMDPRMAARVEQPGPRVFDASQPPPQQGNLMPMEVGNQPGMSDKDMLALRAQQVLGENWGGNEPVQQSMIPMFQDAEASELMRRMGIDTRGRHGMPPPDEDFPTQARVPGGGYKASMNTERGIENITRDYTSPLPAVMNREGLQNAMDAAEKMGSDGIVKVRLNSTNKTIEIYDNGRGMDDATVGDKLFEAFSSGKEGEEGATGGKGIGSAAYIYGGKHFQIETIAVDGIDGIKYRIETGGTPKQHMMGKPETFSRTPVPDETPTGTTIKITLRDDQDMYDATRMMDKIKDHSRNRSSRLVIDAYGDTSGTPLSEIEHTIHPKYGNMDNITDSRFTSSNDDKMIGDFTTTNRNSQVKVLIPQGPTANQSYITVHYLNNGMYQFSDDIPLGSKAEVPKKVLVDIHPLTDDLDELYPFINTREDVKKDIREEVTQFVTENIGAPAVNQRKNRTQELYDKMAGHGVSTAVAGTKRNPLLFDPGDRLTPQERSSLVSNPAVKGLIRVFDKIQDGILTAVGKGSWSDRLEGVGIFLDPGSYGMHIPNPNTKKSSIGINPFIRIEKGEAPKDVAWHTTITNLHEAAHIGTEGGESIQLTPEDMADPRLGAWFQSYMNELTGHQDISYENTGHGVGFGHRLGEVYAQFGVARTYEAAAQIEHALTGGDKSGSYSPEIQRALQLYTESRGRDAVTEDLLSRTGVKQGDRAGVRQEGIPGDTEADRDGAAAGVNDHFNRQNDHPVVAKFRNLPDPREKGFADTRFILPDGTRKSHASYVHAEAAESVGTTLNEGFDAGIIRFTDDGSAEVGKPITHAQAEQLKQALDFDTNPYKNDYGEIYVDIRLPNGELRSRKFTSRASASGIRSAVNQHFELNTDTRVVPRDAHLDTDTPSFQKVDLDEKATTNPVLDKNDTSTWRNVKQKAGWGQGNTGDKPEVNFIKEVLALPSAATTTMDFSAPGRQGLSMILTPQFWKAGKAMFKGLSVDGFNAIDAELKSKPLYKRRIDEEGNVRKSLGEELGSKLFAPASGVGPRAESVASNWLETGGNIPYLSKGYRNTIGVPIRMSNRAYITFLNHLNANRTEFLMNKARDMAIEALDTGKARQGMTPWKQKFSPDEAMNLNPYHNLKLGKEIVDFVNTATGHGPLKTHILPHRSAEVSLESAAGALGSVMFSPGLLASRVRMLNPSTYIMATPFVRKQYAKAALSTVAAWAAFTEMAKMAGGEVGEEPTSADFGKVRIGDTRIDPGGGFLQFVTLYNRLYQGGYTSSSTGEFHKFGEGFQAETQLSNLMRFGSNKLNPVAKFAYDVANASEYNPVHVKDRMAQLFVPLFVQDIIGIVKEDPELVPWLAPMMFGVGAQTYSKGESVGKLIPTESDTLITGGGIADMGPDYIHPKLDY